MLKGWNWWTNCTRLSTSYFCFLR